MPETYFTRAMAALAATFTERSLGCDTDLLILYTLLMLVKGGGVSLKNVHDAWAAWRTVTRPDHPDLIPFSELPAETAEWDRPYAEAICDTAAHLAAAA